MTNDLHIFEAIKAEPHLGIVDAGWAIFTIKVVAGLKEGDHDCWGVCDFDAYEIRLEKKLTITMSRAMMMFARLNPELAKLLLL